MVTHDARAAAIAHRVLFLADGVIVRELGECDSHEILTVMEEVAPREPPHDVVRHPRALGRKLRTALTAIAIVLGVAMISGTFVLTDTIDAGVRRDLHRRTQNADAVISGKRRSTDIDNGERARTPAFDETLLPKVRELPEVAARSRAASQRRHTLDRPGREGDRLGGAPNLGLASTRRNRPSTRSTRRRARGPRPDEVVDRQRAPAKKEPRGRRRHRRPERGTGRDFRISGIVQLARSRSAARRWPGSTSRRRRRLFASEGQLDEIASRRSRRTESQLVSRRSTVLPPTRRCGRCHGRWKTDAADTNGFITFLQRLPARVRRHRALRRGFVIANSLSITIAQRTREFATLRTLGASRRQILQVDHRRGARRRHPRVGGRPVPRARPRQVALRALRRRRASPPEQRARCS